MGTFAAAISSQVLFRFGMRNEIESSRGLTSLQTMHPLFLGRISVRGPGQNIFASFSARISNLAISSAAE